MSLADTNSPHPVLGSLVKDPRPTVTILQSLPLSAGIQAYMVHTTL